MTLRKDRVRYKERSWEPIVANTMARTGCTFIQALLEITPPVNLKPGAEKVILNSDRFQRILMQARNLYAAEIVTDHTFGKNVIAGNMALDARKLREEKKPKDASDVEFKLAKVMGYVQPDTTNVTVLGTLNETELNNALDKVEEQIGASASSAKAVQ